MKAIELRESLKNGLRTDTEEYRSGRTTPIQRLTPFLNDLVTYLEKKEAEEVELTLEERAALLNLAEKCAGEAANTFFDGPTVGEAGKPIGTLEISKVDSTEQVSSDDATQGRTAETKTESDDASKATA